MAKQLNTDTFINLDEDGQPVKQIGTSSLNFTFDANPPEGHVNTFVTPWACREMIYKKFESIWEDAARQNDLVGVEFDRQSLMLILAQNGCEGIRFSFCTYNGHTTLVAFGIENTGKLIAEEMFKGDFIAGDKKPVPGSEEGHGLTLAEFKKLIGADKADFTPDFDKITDQFFDKFV